jgi:hypothetical protein
MKKFMMITLVAIGFIVMATPESNAGVSIGIGFGFPGFCGYPAYYPYGYGNGYQPYYWRHGRKIYYRNRHFR